MGANQMKLNLGFNVHLNISCKESAESSRDRTSQEGVGIGGKFFSLFMRGIRIAKFLILLYAYHEHLVTPLSMVINMI